MTVVVLEDAAADIESGRQFYESAGTEVGEYFTESILSNLASLVFVSRHSSSPFRFFIDVVQALSF